MVFRGGSTEAMEVGHSFRNPSSAVVTGDLIQLRMPVFRALLVGEQG